jgi:ABC-type transport system involved in multi-copper enzyme maturation permease subunit
MMSRHSHFWRMVWKEYRTQRAFWLVLAAAAVALMLLVVWLSQDMPDYWDYPWGIVLVMPGIFALGSAAMTFAGESEEGTIDLLRIYAARPHQLYFAKFGFSAAATLAMFCLLVVAAKGITWKGHHPWGNVSRESWVRMMIFTPLVLAWGFCISAFCRKVLTAVSLTSVLMPLVTSGIAKIANADLGRSEQILLIPLPFLMLLAYARMRAQLRGESLAGREWNWQRFRLQWMHRRRRSRAVARLDQWAGMRKSTPLWRQTWGRLLWLQAKQFVSRGHLLWIAALLILVFYPMGNSAKAPDEVRSIMGGSLAALFIGVWTFQSENGRRTRFLADHGLSPHLIWLSAQIVAIGFLLVMTFPFVVEVHRNNALWLQWNWADPAAIYDGSMFHPLVPGVAAVGFASAVFCLAFALGQCLSMLIRRTVVAWFLAFLLLLLLVPLVWTAWALQIPVSISLIPLLGLLLSITCFWSRNWLLELGSVRSWSWLAAYGVTGCVLIWGGIGVFRVLEIPHPGFVHNAAAQVLGQLQPRTPSEIHTAALYGQAAGGLSVTSGGWHLESIDQLRLLQQKGALGNDNRGRPLNAELMQRLMVIRETGLPADWTAVPPELVAWRQENEESLQQCLTATQLPECALLEHAHPDLTGSHR